MPNSEDSPDSLNSKDPKDSNDLSQLIEAPASSTPSADTAESAETQPLPSEPAPTEPVQFESLEEFSHETPNPESSPETAPSGLDMSLVDTPQPETLPEMQPEAPAEADAAILAATAEPGPELETEIGIDTIKKFSDGLATSDPQIAAAFPFTLKIEGKLSPEDAEKLLTILTRENMGFREVDLEPQIAEGKVLIPRISEYAGVLLIQALRAVPARFSFGPADEIFSTPETRDEPAQASGDFVTDWTDADEASDKASHGASKIPVTGADALPQFSRASAIDTVVTSGLLTTRAVEAASSEEYEALLEALIRELRFKAHRRGANGILSLKVQLTPLTLPTDYRVTVTGTAVLGTENFASPDPPLG